MSLRDKRFALTCTSLRSVLNGQSFVNLDNPIFENYFQVVPEWLCVIFFLSVKTCLKKCALIWCKMMVKWSGSYCMFAFSAESRAHWVLAEAPFLCLVLTYTRLHTWVRTQWRRDVRGRLAKCLIWLAAGRGNMLCAGTWARDAGLGLAFPVRRVFYFLLLKSWWHCETVPTSDLAD